MLKLTDQHIALVYRVPLPILGIGGAPLGSTEALMQKWLARGLGFALNHIEEAFGIAVRPQGPAGRIPRIRHRGAAALRFKDRVEGFARGVISGIFAPTRRGRQRRWRRCRAATGTCARTQQQVVPLSYGSAMKPPDPNAAAAPPEPEPEEDEPDGRDYAELILAAAQRHAERAG